jgi:radical SAM superfamily enzyme YgiQ (UPF0313 family)
MKTKVFITTAPDKEYTNNAKIRRIFTGIPELHHNLGLGYLAASLEGIAECSFLDSSQLKMSTAEVMRRVREELSDDSLQILGISTYSHKKNAALLLAGEAKKWCKDIIIIAGGWGPSIEPLEYITSPHIDYVCQGEGDVTLAEFVKAIKARGIANNVNGIWYKANTDFGKAPDRKLVKDLDQLPFPKRTPHLGSVWYRGELVPSVDIVSSRGCYAKCGFCDREAVQPGYRERSPENVVEEVLGVLEGKPSKKMLLGFWDLNFLVNPSRIEKIISMLRTEGKEPLIIGDTRINDIIRAEQVISKYAANFEELRMGVESFNDKFLERWSKGYGLEEIVKAMSILDKQDITYKFYTIGADMDTDAKEVAENKKLMFESGMLKRHFWIHLGKHMFKMLDYTGMPKLREYAQKKKYTDAHYFLFDAINAFSLQNIQDVFWLPERSFLREKIRADPQYLGLLELARNFFRDAYDYATLGFAPKKGKTIKQVPSEEVLKATGKDILRIITNTSKRLVNKLNRGVREAVFRVSKEELKRIDCSPEEKARIYSDMSLMARYESYKNVKANRLSRYYMTKAIRHDPANVFYRYMLAEDLLGCNEKYVQRKSRELFSELSIEQLKPLMVDNAFSQTVAVPFYFTDKNRTSELMAECLEMQPVGGVLSTAAYFTAMKKNYGEAFELIEQHLSYYPTSAAGWYTKALIGREANKPEIVRDCNKALRWLKAPRRFLVKETSAK